MGHIVHFINKINERVGTADSYLIYLLTGLMLFAVVMRRFLNLPNIWSYETSQFIYGAFFILAGGYALRHRLHVTMDILYNRLSLRGQAIIDLVTSIFFFIFVGLIVWTGWEAGWRSLQIGEASDSSWGPPIYPIKLIIPVGGFLLLIQGVAKFITDLSTLTRRKPVEH